MIQKSKSVSPMSNDGRNAYVINHLTEECPFTVITKTKRM